MMGDQFLVEHKATSQDISPGSPYWAKLSINAEAALYIRAARDAGFPVRGIIYDLAKKPGLKPLKASSKRATDETPLEYGERCLAAISEDPDAWFQRGKVVRLDSEAHEAAIDLIARTKAIRAARRSGHYPRNPDACERFHRWCEFFPVCTNATTIDDSSRYEDRDTGPTISKSSLEAWNRCPREFYFLKVRGRRSKTSSPALRQGTAWHVGLEHWFNTLNCDAALQLIQTPDEFETMKLRAMLLAYDAKWRDEPWQANAVEQAFELPIIDPRTGKRVRGVKLNGKFDAIITEEAHETSHCSSEDRPAA